MDAEMQNKEVGTTGLLPQIFESEGDRLPIIMIIGIGS